jgi:diguanylate cyclase (GGDEF)-like protein
VISDPTLLPRTSAEVLHWQARVRIGVAGVVGGVALALRLGGVTESTLGLLAGSVVGYLAIVLAIRGGTRGMMDMPNWATMTTVLADVAVVFAFTAATSSPSYYGRTLTIALFLVHLAETYFGSGHATAVLVATIAGYVGLVATASVGVLDWGESLWSLALFAVTGAVMIGHHDAIQRRLLSIVRLFERAEEGDFAQAYDVRADRYPDAVTRVGRAYNRVRVQLASMVLTDPLTGCLNRRGFDQSMARELARAARSGSDLSLLALDLDHFKEINDTYGHLAGDAVLRDIGGLLVQTARAGDMVARTGGEEFSILLPETATAGASQFATRVCETVRRHVFHVNGKPITLTVSVGAVSSATAGEDLGANLKERADQALYTAKRAGRDCVHVWRDEGAGSPGAVDVLWG